MAYHSYGVNHEGFHAVHDVFHLMKHVLHLDIYLVGDIGRANVNLSLPANFKTGASALEIKESSIHTLNRQA
jgi:hypothetical protein